ncbi:rhoGEF domain-containing protein gxcJ-like isoform X2 [Chironomus tepperi]|uniref:rhoGEF domain-containing protein gxcJ-like isoform X2 n=1 Tax=Chironomus tepperi TaxID=113505 RepID=UPI00391F9C00
MNSEETIVMNGMQPKDDEMKWNHKKRAKNPFLLFCETVLNHERELLSETLNSSQESLSENQAPEGQNSSSIENSTFNSDSDGANGEISKNYTNDGGGGDSFNSVTCFCGKPFAGRPMIECSACLTWLHMSCVKVKRKNIPEFYYCDNCKSNGLLSPNAIGSSGEEGTPIRQQNGTISSNNMDGILYSSSTHQNNQNNSNNTTNNTINNLTAATKPKKPKTMKKSSASLMMMNSSDNIKNNTNSDSKYLSKKSSNVNGKLKKIRQTTKKVRPAAASSNLTKTISSSSLAAAASLTALSLNNQVSPSQINTTILTNGIATDNSNNLLKSPIATNNNNIYNNGDVIETQSERTPIIESNGAATMVENSEKFNNKRLKLL